MDMSGFMSAARAATIFDITLRTLSNWERKGILVPTRINGKRYYRVSEIRRLLEAP